MAGLTKPRSLAVADDRNTFDCGRDSLNQWFRRHAWHNQEASVTRTSVMYDAASSAIAGFVALSAGHIERAHLPKSAQRNRPDQTQSCCWASLRLTGSTRAAGALAR